MEPAPSVEICLAKLFLERSLAISALRPSDLRNDEHEGSQELSNAPEGVARFESLGLRGAPDQPARIVFCCDCPIGGTRRTGVAALKGYNFDLCGKTRSPCYRDVGNDCLSNMFYDPLKDDDSTSSRSRTGHWLPIAQTTRLGRQGCGKYNPCQRCGQGVLRRYHSCRRDYGKLAGRCPLSVGGAPSRRYGKTRSSHI